MASVTEKKWAQQAALGREKKKLLYCSTFDIEGPFHKKSYNGYSYFSSQIFLQSSTGNHIQREKMFKSDAVKFP